MNNMYNNLKRMMSAAEFVGSVDEVHMGDWLGKAVRIDIHGATNDGKPFVLTLEVDKEVQKDA